MVEKQKKSDVSAEEKELEVTEETEATETTEESSEEKETPEIPEEGGEVTEDDFTPKTDDEGEEGETSLSPEEDATSKEGDDKGQVDELSLDDFAEPEEEKKSGVQKRIDRLVAEKKSLEERLSKLEQAPKKDDNQPEYSEAQLRAAMAKAVEENDANLMYEIMDYRVKKAQKEAIDGEKKRQSELYDAQQRHQREWTSAVDEYSYLADTEDPELFKGSHRELNINDPQSMLYRLAAKLYNDKERAERYGKDGGQRLAISDALRMILRKRNTKAESKENKLLKRKLAKEKQKSSVSSGKAVKAEKSAPISHKTSLESYLEERKKAKTAVAGEL